MTPSKSNITRRPCLPISSNCVRWEGPTLCCIEVCPDDTESDIIFKVTQEMCRHGALLNLTDLDMKGLEVDDKNLITVLQAIIDKLQD